MKPKYYFAAVALSAALGIVATSRAQSGAGQASVVEMKALGTTSLTDAGAGIGTNDDFIVRPSHENELPSAMASANQGAGTGAPVVLPDSIGTSIARSNPGFSGFNGLNHADQRNAGTGNYVNTQFSLEPPDQGLAVGEGFVLENVNDVLAVYDKNGTRLKGPTALNQFFNLAPAVIRTPPVRRGEFLTDPRCYFDRQTERWFITVGEIDVNPVTGAFLRGHLLIAVSQTEDPTLGFNLFSIDVGDDGLHATPSHPHCPCFGDQPLIGADANGFYISTNEFPVVGPGFNGAQIYAMSKKRLARGFVPTVVQFSGLTFPSGVAFSVQPAFTTPRGESREGEDEDVEYLMSTLPFSLALQNQIAIWALTDTDSLSEANPHLKLTRVVLNSEVYGNPPDAAQKAGPPSSRPLGTSLNAPEELLATDDQRMQQVVFTDGILWSALTTVVKQGPKCTGFDPKLASGFGPDCYVGIAWFKVRPSIDDGALKGRVQKQGYVTLQGNYVFYPSIAVSRDGKGLIAFSLSGKDYFPSVGYVQINAEGKAGPIHIAAAGAGPEDGFSGYGTGGSARWGDYSAAVADDEGQIWFANEYISGAPRTVSANWATFIGHTSTDEAEDDEGSD
jgi:hypothetical protein